MQTLGLSQRHAPIQQEAAAPLAVSTFPQGEMGGVI